MTQSAPGPLSVTVVISAFNEAQGVRACLDSLYRQTRLPDELIVVDDGSTDDTPQLLAQCAAESREPPQQVVTLPRNRGVPSARNAGAAQGSGELIAFVDADACAPDNWLQDLVAPFADPAVALVGGPDRAPESDSSFSLAVDYSLRSWISSGRLRLRNPFAPLAPGGCNLAVRRKDFEALAGFDVRLDRRGEEKEFIQRLRRAGRGIAFSPQALIWHQRRVSLGDF